MTDCGFTRFLAITDHDQQIMRAMKDERNADIHNSLRLELEGQRAQDDELSQLREDILNHANAVTDQIIENFANLRHDSNLCHMCGDDHNSDEECFNHEPANDFNEASAWWVEPQDSSDDAPNSLDDDLNENTDTEDGGDDVIALLQANIKLLAFL